MSDGLRLVEVAELDFAFEPEPWDFAATHRQAIDAHWASLRAEKPALFNGRVLLLGRRRFVERPDGGMNLEGAFFATDYADFVAWRAFGDPALPVANAFSMAALRSADGGFLLGEMAAHTLNAGQVYFPAGTPDLSDVFDGKVDLEVSAKRELLEETGVSAAETTVRPGWTTVIADRRIACMKEMTIPLAAEAAKARIDSFLAQDPRSELARMHVIRGPDDLARVRTPDFMIAYIRARWTAR